METQAKEEVRKANRVGEIPKDIDMMIVEKTQASEEKESQIVQLVGKIDDMRIVLEKIVNASLTHPLWQSAHMESTLI